MEWCAAHSGSTRYHRRRVLCLTVFLVGTYLTLCAWRNSGRCDFVDRSTNGGGSGQVTSLLRNSFCDESVRLDYVERHLEDAIRLKASVMRDLLALEEKRSAMIMQINLLQLQTERIQQEVQRLVSQLDQVKVSISQALLAQKDALEKNMPEVYLPAPYRQRRLPGFPTAEVQGSVAAAAADFGPWCTTDGCLMERWSDYRRCPITVPFSFYLWPETYGNYSNRFGKRVFARLRDAFGRSDALIADGSKACVHVVLVAGISSDEFVAHAREWTDRSSSSVNFLLVHFDPVGNEPLPAASSSFIIASTDFTTATLSPGSVFRPSYDVVLPALSAENVDLMSLPLIVPARRKYLLSALDLSMLFATAPAASVAVSNAFLSGNAEFVTESLRRMKLGRTSDEFYFACPCSADGCSSKVTSKAEFELLSDCWSSEVQRRTLLLRSTFTLIIAPASSCSSFALQRQIFEALRCGSIPVILGSSSVMPFAEVLDWRRASLRFPTARASELHLLLRSLTDGEILGLRQHGRVLFERYLMSPERVVQTLLGIIRSRMNLPPKPAQGVSIHELYNESYPMKTASLTPARNALDSGEFLGPLELPVVSPAYQKNFTFVAIHSYDLWNRLFMPFQLYPNDPFEEPLPSDAKFVGSSYGFRPINSGTGGSGKEFRESLGSNFPREQFTVTCCSCNTDLREGRGADGGADTSLRPALLKQSDRRLERCRATFADSVHTVMALTCCLLFSVAKMANNSLNNRFLPFDAIETEAVLSMDDDIHLRHDEIVFAFRVWRETRDRIVGFPGRFHAWHEQTQQWAYNSNHSCELSMVLTGAAFIHKYYFYLYSYEMPMAILQKVDELLNCEDIAMNFLVSHITRKPPLKVTSRWTFRCTNCAETLSDSDTHFTERHHCINFFTKVFGYNPLLYTQFRLDSVLFKTKIPHYHNKCFNFL